jgi:AcrR family transcriptional regulator
MSGRKAEAARNDSRILESARAVFVANPAAPISAVAEHAGVGISALYRRYPSKEDLLRKLCTDGLHVYIDAVRTAVDSEGDPWEAFATFMERVVDADTHALTANLAGTFTPTEDLWRDSQESVVLNERLIDRVHAAGVLRADVKVEDLSFIFEQLSSVRLGDEGRTRELRKRYLTLFLQALRADGEDRGPLPGPPPTQDELQERWVPR